MEVWVILYLNFEELTALGAEAGRVLDAGAGRILDVATGRVLDAGTGHGIAAPTQLLTEVDSFAQLLIGDIAITSLEHHSSMRRVLDVLLRHSRARLDATIIDQHPAAEAAVAAYFDYAHMLAASARLDAIGLEMRALASLMTGADPESDSARRFAFPD
jgi:hypothetical protein